MDYVRFAAIKNALRGLPVHWEERDLIRLGWCSNRRTLPFVRTGGKYSAPAWNAETLIDWFGKKYASAPDVVETFTHRIREATQPRSPFYSADVKNRAKAKVT
jgi:hypothetical protein